MRGGGQFWLVVGFCLIGEQQILKVVFKAKCPECTRMFRIAELSHFFQCCGCLLNRSGSRSMFDRIWSIFKPVLHLTLKQSWIRIEICNIIVKNWKGGSCGFKRLNCVNNFFCGDRDSWKMLLIPCCNFNQKDLELGRCVSYSRPENRRPLRLPEVCTTGQEEWAEQEKAGKQGEPDVLISYQCPVTPTVTFKL